MIDRINSRRYLMEKLGAVLFYTIAVLTSVRLLEQQHLTGLSKVLVALLPVPGVVMLFIAMARHLARIDELQRQILIEGFAVAGGMTAMLAMTATFIENAGFANPPSWWWFVCFMVIWPFASGYSRKRYE